MQNVQSFTQCKKLFYLFVILFIIAYNFADRNLKKVFIVFGRD